MATIYRKHRPQNFQEVVGQNHIKTTLQHEIASGNIAHAYLFCGPRGVGKTTVARVLAKSLNCLSRKDKQYEPCNKCDMCEDITGSRSIDVIEIDAASHTGVDNVRENIIAAARITPTRAKHKVFIIDEVHMLSISAFNALLKILEEPPENVIFVLCTTEVHKIPGTIISRTQRFDFKRISVSDIVKKLSYIAGLEEITINKNILENIARHSEGHMRDAESILGQVIAISGKEVTDKEADLVIPRGDLIKAVGLVEFLEKKDAASAISLINTLINEGIDLKRFLVDFLELLRKIMLIKISPGLADKLSIEFGESIELKVNNISKELELYEVLDFIDKFSEAKNNMEKSFIIQLPIETAIALICINKSTLKPAPARTFAPVQGNTGPKNISKPAVEPAVKKNIETIGNLNLDAIISRWNEVQIKTKKFNHSLSFILRVCEPKELNSEYLTLAFKYKFHRDRIEDMSIKKLVENVLKEVYGCQILIKTIIDENLKPASPALNTNNNGQELKINEKKEDMGEKKEDKEVIDNLLKNFGGKIIN